MRRGGSPHLLTAHPGAPGDIAQLGERLFCIQEAVGSMPSISTTDCDCGHVHSIQAVKESDGAKLRRLAKSESGRWAETLRWAASVLDYEDEVAAETRRELRRVYREVTAELRRLAASGDTSVRAALLRANEADLYQFFVDAGIFNVNQSWQASLAEAQGLASQWTVAQGLPEAARALDAEALVAVAAAKRRALATIDDGFVRPALRVMTEGLQSALTLEQMPEAVKRVQKRLNVTTSQAEALVNSEIAQFDRAVVEEQANAAGVEAYRYQGPLDGITRPFCRTLLSIDKVWAKPIIARLANGVTAVNPLFSGGGYGCRHLWIPVIPETIAERGWRFATVADAAAVNASAIRQKKKRGR